jgi:hypothetical protein
MTGHLGTARDIQIMELLLVEQIINSHFLLDTEFNPITGHNLCPVVVGRPSGIDSEFGYCFAYVLTQEQWSFNLGTCHIHRKSTV